MSQLNVLTYQDQKITVLQKPQDPANLIVQAATLTQNTMLPKESMMSGELDKLKGPSERSKSILKFLIKAEHTSLLEHISWTFYIENVSRSFLAQITRHRMGSFTSASQHYSDYRHMPFIVSVDQVNDEHMRGALRHALEAYKAMVDSSTPPEEARQCLPNAAAVNLIWTVNARSLFNFFEQRYCYRNVEEMQVFCQKLWLVIAKSWLEFAKLCGPYCFTQGRCNQGKMSCGKSRLEGRKI